MSEWLSSAHAMQCSMRTEKVQEMLVSKIQASLNNNDKEGATQLPYQALWSTSAQRFCLIHNTPFSNNHNCLN